MMIGRGERDLGGERVGFRRGEKGIYGFLGLWDLGGERVGFRD